MQTINETVQKEIKLYRRQLVERTKKKQEEMLRLLHVKCEKTANLVLPKRFTQLSYLSKEEQEEEISFPKEILLDKIIAFLSQF
jgi:hypothetical protein